MKIDTVVMLYPFTPFSLDKTMKPQPLHCVLCFESSGGVLCRVSGSMD